MKPIRNPATRGWMLLAALLLLTAGCLPKAETITGTERDQVLAYAEPAADNLLQAYNENDYQAFVRDYDATMLKLTDTASYQKLYDQLMGSIGKYESRTIEGVYKTGTDTVTVVYSAVFEQDDPVYINLSFQAGGEHKVSGLYFNSAKLREK